MEKQLRVALKALFRSNKRHSPVTIIAVIAISAVIIGEVFAYGINVHHFDSNVDASVPGALKYSVSSNGSDPYSVVLMDRHDVKPIERLYIYADENYVKNYDSYQNYYKNTFNIRVDPVEQKSHAEQMQKFLEIRGFKNVTIVDSEKLRDVLRNDVEKSNCLRCGLLVASFSLPFDVYHGCKNDLLFQWIDRGGHLYWSSSEIGRFYYKNDKINEVENCQTLFFGPKYANTSDTKYVNVSNNIKHATSAIDNGFREALTLTNTGLGFALNIDAIPNSLGIGYKENEYSSIAFVKHNDGMICVIGVIPESFPRLEDTAQIISAGITYATDIVATCKENVTRGTVSDTIYYKPIDNLGVYIYIGGTYTTYGRCFQ